MQSKWCSNFAGLNKSDVQIKISFVSVLVKLHLEEEILKVVTGFLVL